MADSEMETWELWFPGAASTGLLLARAKIDPAAVVWVHAAPEMMAVSVRNAQDERVAQGEPLERAGKRYPMTRLWREGAEIRREDRWPTDADLGETVILPGGEAGVITGWWNAEDEREWRWQVEFYNHT